MNPTSITIALIGISAFFLFLHFQKNEDNTSERPLLCQSELQRIEILEAEIRGLRDGAALSN